MKTTRRKKRKIFKIVKIDRKRKLNQSVGKNQKLNSKNKTKLNHEEDDLEDSDVDVDAENNHNSQSQSNSKVHPNSLISISKEVYDYLNDKVFAKGTNVTEHILEHLKNFQTKLSFKNVQRRVYDAINVMNAVGILYKDKNCLYFKGNNMNMTTKVKDPSATSQERRTKMMKEKLNAKCEEINKKQHELSALCSKVNIHKIILFLVIPFN
jgi:hypothetical protein